MWTILWIIAIFTLFIAVMLAALTMIGAVIVGVVMGIRDLRKQRHETPDI